ncbi:MAG: hypothetical protein LUE17_16035 [Planctomycetaceae bacterium]|nr:hypothetical protein [Planctomycetaceae bacterium]
MKKVFFLAAMLLAACPAVMAEDHNPDLVPNRLSFAKAGEWASYTLANGYTQKLTVVSRDGDPYGEQVTIKVENIYDGEVVETREISQDAGEPFTAPQVPYDQGITVNLRQEAVPFEGRQLAVSVVEILHYDEDPEAVTREEYWISSDIPVFGILRKIENGEVEWELADYGEK